MVSEAIVSQNAIEQKIFLMRGQIYDKPYGGSKVGRVKDGFVYDRPYGGSKIGKTDIPAGAAYWLLKK